MSLKGSPASRTRSLRGAPLASSWCPGFRLSLSLQLFNHPGALTRAVDQMETIKLFARKGGKR
ncbi:hypothetical protein GH733_009150, partial [Mirounga leonina]